MKEETTIERIDYAFFDYPVCTYRCEKCGTKFIDTNDNFQYCPYCGRKIVDNKEEEK